MKKLVSIFYKPFLETNDLNERAQRYAAEKGLDYEWIKIPECDFTEEKVIAALRDADAGIIDTQVFDEKIFSQINEKCKLIVRYGVGYDAVNLEDAKKYGVHVARTTGANAIAVAEMAMTMTLVLLRRIEEGRLVKESPWNTVIGEDLTGKTVGILGFGAVGRRFANMLKGFGCRVLAYDGYRDEAAASELGVEYADLDTLLKEADVISVHLALNDQTKGIICKENIEKMKSSVIIINTARGGLVRDEDLYEALRTNRIAGAGLDVFTEEPLPADSPYREVSNVILTSHMSSASMGAYWNMYKTAIDIAADYFEGKEPMGMLV